MKKNFLIAIVGLSFVSAAAAAVTPQSQPAKSSKSAAAAPKQNAAPNAKAPRVQMASGKVVSADATSLVLSESVKGKTSEAKFTLNPETQKEGEMKPGARVMVKYRVENGMNVATQVKPTPVKAAPHKHKA